MVKYYNYDIVFAEIPDETTLALNITNCPNRCRGCHSPHLQRDIGQILDENELKALLDNYGRSVTCVCFMGGDAVPFEIAELSSSVKKILPGLKTAWYSGGDCFPENFPIRVFDYIKLGSWDETKGSLTSRTTNQHLYKIDAAGNMEDITFRFWKR